MKPHGQEKTQGMKSRIYPSALNDPLPLPFMWCRDLYINTVPVDSKAKQRDTEL